jgi:hypothetical protein
MLYGLRKIASSKDIPSLWTNPTFVGLLTGAAGGATIGGIAGGLTNYGVVPGLLQGMAAGSALGTSAGGIAQMHYFLNDPSMQEYRDKILNRILPNTIDIVDGVMESAKNDVGKARRK